jgi:hypothetical protein
MIGGALSAHAAEQRMTKLVVQMITPTGAGDPLTGKSRTMYICGTKYARVEEDPDQVAQTHALIITQEPDCWVINLMDKTGKHLVDEGPKFIARAPIFWTSSGQPEPEFQDLEFGRELKFFGEGRGKELAARVVDGKKCKVLSIKTGEHEAIAFLDPKNNKPVQIELHKFGRLTTTAHYLSYETKPFEAALFQPPKDVKLTEGGSASASGL